MQCGILYGQEGRDVAQATTAQAELPTICAWSAGTHLSKEERTVPTKAPGTLHTAHRAMPQIVHTPSMHPRAPKPIEQMDSWRCMWIEQANWD